MNKCDLSNSLFAKSFYAFAGLARHYVIRLVGWEDSDMDFQIRGKIGCYLLPIRKNHFLGLQNFTGENNQSYMYVEGIVRLAQQCVSSKEELWPICKIGS